MKATSDASALQGLVLGVLLAGLHETGHLILSKLDLAELELAKTLKEASWMGNIPATEGGQRDIGDLELVGGSRHFG